MFNVDRMYAISKRDMLVSVGFHSQIDVLVLINRISNISGPHRLNSPISRDSSPDTGRADDLAQAVDIGIVRQG